jgi:hypothetical protein
MGVLALAVIALQAHGASAPASAKPAAKSYPFTFDTLLEEAKRPATQ